MRRQKFSVRAAVWITAFALSVLGVAVILTSAVTAQCVHSEAEAKLRTVDKETGTYTYTCADCKAEITLSLTGDLTNPENDTVCKNKPYSIRRAEMDGFDTDRPRILYLENGVIGKTASPYWIFFSVTPKSIASPESGDLNDRISTVFRGWNMLSAEPSFSPASQLRIMPDGWEKGSGAVKTEKGTADGRAEVKILKKPYQENIGDDTVFYRDTETVAYLETGKTTDFAIRIDPRTGVYDVFVDGEYKATSQKNPAADYNPQIYFHDTGAGEYTYTDIRILAEET